MDFHYTLVQTKCKPPNKYRLLLVDNSPKLLLLHCKAYLKVSDGTGMASFVLAQVTRLRATPHCLLCVVIAAIEATASHAQHGSRPGSTSHTIVNQPFANMPYPLATPHAS